MQKWKKRFINTLIKSLPIDTIIDLGTMNHFVKLLIGSIRQII